MDLSFSPDWPAWLCYFIVLFFGILTGWREVVEKLESASGIWRQPMTWVLFIILGVGPILLFWLLDRVGALHDTSAIAAAIVGVAYTQILKGDSEYKAPGSTSSIWNFLSWWRERIAKSVQDGAANNALAFDQVVCNLLADSARLGSATALALKLSSDPVAFQTTLTNERARLAAANPALDPSIIDYKIAELVYREIQADPSDRRLMVEHQLIDQALVDKFFSTKMNWWAGGAAIVAVIAVLGFLVAGFSEIGTARWIEREYLLSRLSKPNGTGSDLDRVSARLGYLMRLDTKGEEDRAAALSFWLVPIHDVLRDSTLPMGRVDVALQAALAVRDHGGGNRPFLAMGLAPALRNSNVDARRRIQMALVYLADGKRALPASLKDWNPTESDSITDVERQIDAWLVYWTAVKPSS